LQRPQLENAGWDVNNNFSLIKLEHFAARVARYTMAGTGERQPVPHVPTFFGGMLFYGASGAEGGGTSNRDVVSEYLGKFVYL